MQRRPARAHVDVVAVEGDVDRPEVDLDAAALLDQPAQAMRERDAARVDADQRDRVELGVLLDDLVRDTRERARERLRIEDDASGRNIDAGHGALQFKRELPFARGLRACACI